MKVPLQDGELERIFDFPSLFEIFVLRARLSGIFVGESKNTPEDLGNLYLTVSKVQHERNLLRWLKKLDGALTNYVKDTSKNGYNFSDLSALLGKFTGFKRSQKP